MPGDMLVSKGHATTGTMQISVVCTATWDHGIKSEQVTAKGNVLVHGPTKAGVFVDLSGPRLIPKSTKVPWV